MAGAGYKLFNTGDVLTAAQVNTYLQEQTVMVFASSTARTTALSGVLAEGMMSYLQDTNSVEVYNGSSWVNVGNAGDLTEIVAGTGITVTSGTGPIPTVALTTPVAATNGGTAQSTYTTGDLLYASGTNTLAKRAIGSTDQVLKVSGGIPTWAVDPTTDVVTTAGDLIYGTGADAVTRLGIGTAGQVLKVNSGATAPEWGAASASGMTFISKTSWSSAASHTVDNVFTSTYTNYMIVIENWIGSNVNNDPEFQLRVGSSTQATGYYGSSFGTDFNSSTLIHKGTSNASQFTFSEYIGAASGTFIVMNIERVGQGTSVVSNFSGHGINDSSAHQYLFGGLSNTGGAYTGFVLKVSTGTSSGDVTVYGLAKA